MAMPQIALQSYVMTAFQSEQERSQNMAKFGALNSLGVVIGPLATTSIADMEHVDTVVGCSGYFNGYGGLDCTEAFKGSKHHRHKNGTKPQRNYKTCLTEKLQWSKFRDLVIAGL